jgi:hypothetical protein
VGEIGRAMRTTILIPESSSDKPREPGGAGGSIFLGRDALGLSLGGTGTLLTCYQLPPLQRQE